MKEAPLCLRCQKAMSAEPTNTFWFCNGSSPGKPAEHPDVLISIKVFGNDVSAQEIEAKSKEVVK